ncbi:MAG: IS4 family transposase [Armatimonadota bacterium]
MKYSTSLFAQLLQELPKAEFARLVTETHAERHSKGFASWDQCVAMLFCQLAQAQSLREISDGLAVTCGKLNHLGLTQAPAKSTLAYANAHRSADLFERLFYTFLGRCQAAKPGKAKRFRFKNPLDSLDGTVLDLCLSLFPWAEFRQTKGAVKLHLLLDHAGYFPTFAAIGPQKTLSEIAVAKSLDLPKGSIVAIDRGYCSYALFYQWHQAGIFFVTRLKDNAAYRVVQTRRVPEHRHVVADELIELTSVPGQRQCPVVLRLVTVWDEATQREFVFLTNNLTLGATTIAAIYRDRWQIECFFKVLKQHLKIKTFVGTSANALKIQIWTALLAILLIKYLQFVSRCQLPLCRLFALLRWNLFTYRPLWDWLTDPFATPPEQPPYQMALAF